MSTFRGRRRLANASLSGVISLTLAAQSPLHFIRHLPHTAAAEAGYQLRQRDQVSDSAKRTPIAENDLRVRGHDVRPLPRNGAKSVLVDLQQEPPAGPVGSLAYADELLSAEGMERVRDPHKVRRRNRTICILNRVTSASSADASRRCGVEVTKRCSK